ncbi:hypothetical protein MTO96_033759 [Rhipicephalus appendiculatus]
MAVNLLLDLYCRIQEASAQDLQRLDQHNVAWLPQLRALPPAMVVQQVHHALRASPSVTVFLERLAWLYCWLMQTRHIGPWLLYRFGAAARRVDYGEFLEDLADVLQSIPRASTISAWLDPEVYYVCLITYANPITLGCEAIFLVLWRGQRFAAARSRSYEQLRTLTTALHIALRG